MALQHILDAIVNDADKRIQQTSAQTKQRLKDAREASENRLATARQKIAESVDLKKRQLKEKTLSYALMKKRKVMLEQKQMYMNDLYELVLQKLGELPKDQAEKFLESCIATLPAKGTILPSAAHEALLKKMLPKTYEIGKAIQSRGGFIFSNDTVESNFTFEHLVKKVLRPQTEIEVAKELFQSQH